MKKTVSTSGASLRLVWASWSSVSKSEMARSPRTIEVAPTGRQKSTVRPSNGPRRRATPPRQRLLEEPRTRATRSSAVERRLPRVHEHRDHEAVEEAHGTTEDVEVPVGDRVEGPG